MEDDGERIICKFNPKHGEQIFHSYRGKNDTKQWLVDPLEQSDRCFADGEQMRDAENGIEAFGKVDGKDVSVDAEMRNEKPDQNDRNERIGNIDFHGIYLLSKPFHHRVRCGIHVHDGNERREQTNVIACVCGGVECFSDFVRKADQNSRNANREEHGERPYATDHVADAFMTVLHTAFGKLGNEQTRKRADQRGGIENDGKRHAVDASVGDERCRMRISAFAKTAWDQNVFKSDQSRPHIGGKGDGKGDAEQLSSFLTANRRVVKRKAFPFVVPIQKSREKTGGNFGNCSAQNQRATGPFNSATHKKREQIHGGKNLDRLLADLYDGVFIDTSDRDEITVECRCDGDERKGDGKQTKRGDSSTVVKPFFSDCRRSAGEKQGREYSKRDGISQGTAHGGRNRLEAVFANRIHHQTGHTEIDARGCESECKSVNA